MNECDNPENCKNGVCVNTVGSYYCICSPPWTLAIDRNSCVTPEEQAGEFFWLSVPERLQNQGLSKKNNRWSTKLTRKGWTWTWEKQNLDFKLITKGFLPVWCNIGKYYKTESTVNGWKAFLFQFFSCYFILQWLYSEKPSSSQSVHVYFLEHFTTTKRCSKCFSVQKLKTIKNNRKTLGIKSLPE